MPRPRAWNSTLPAPTKPIGRKKRIRSKGGRLFPQSPEDKRYFDALGRLLKDAGLLQCEGCEYFLYLVRAHLDPLGRGGRDRNNIGLLCAPCHTDQEKRTDAFNAECGVDLWAKARARTARFDDAQSVARFIEEEIERGAV